MLWPHYPRLVRLGRNAIVPKWLFNRATLGLLLCVGLLSVGSQGGQIGPRYSLRSATLASTVVHIPSVSLASDQVVTFGSLPGRQMQLGPPNVPVVATLPGTVLQATTSNSAIYVLTTAGLFAEGVGTRGQLGNGTYTSSLYGFVQVNFPSGVTITSLPNLMPADTAFAIDSNGNVWGWGQNADSSLCMVKLNISTPIELPLTNVSLATGQLFHAVYDENGTVVACGNNAHGELGDGNFKLSRTPVAVVGLTSSSPVVGLTSSWEGTGAWFADGTYDDWGYNAMGELGNGNDTDSAYPVQVPLPAGAQQVSQGGNGGSDGQSVALLTNGDVYGWGYQLGSTPVLLASNEGTSYVDAGGTKLFLVNPDGSTNELLEGNPTLSPVLTGNFVAVSQASAASVAWP